MASKIVVEVKRGTARPGDVIQTREYLDDLGKECVAAVLIAKSFSKEAVVEAVASGVRLVRYGLASECEGPRTFEQLRDTLELQIVR
jgi:RecB family endonuclease NucS